MNFLKVVTFILVTFSVSNVFSQNVGSTTVPAEAWFCEIKDGYTMDDIREVSKGVEAFSKKTGMKGSQFIFTTFMGEMNPNAFVLMTVWPDFEMMGQGFQNLFTEGTGDDTFAKWNESTNCMQRNLLTVENTWTIE